MARIIRESVGLPPNIQLLTVRAPNGELCRVIQVTDGTGTMLSTVQLNQKAAVILGRALSQPISDVILPEGVQGLEPSPYPDDVPPVPNGSNGGDNRAQRRAQRRGAK